MKKIYNVLFIVLLASVSSCQKWLDLKPRDGITHNDFWKTKEDVNAAVAGMYSSLLISPPGVSDKALTEYMFIWGEIRADMIDQGPSSSTDEKDIMDTNILPTNTLVKWDAFYRTINYCNTIIDNAPSVRDSDPTYSETALKAHVGEALAIRSMMYFYLVRSLGDVPLKLTATIRDKDIKEIGKAADSVVLKQIVGDLKIAESGVPTNYGTTLLNKSRITKSAVNALQADVYLWMENYTDCILACQKVIDSERFSLVTANSNWYNNVFYNGFSNETIFQLSYSSSVNNPFNALLVNSRRRFIASPFVVSEFFKPDEVDPTVNFDIRGGSYFDSGTSIINKWGTENPSFVSWQVYRYSDILLMQAEAWNYAGSPSSALEIVKELRESRKAVASTNPEGVDETNPDVASLGKYILEERAREFAFEGKRWYDVLRYTKRNNYAESNRDVLQAIVLNTVSPNLQQSALSKYKDKNALYFPIHQDELFTDLTLTQNPFYNK